MPTYAWFSLWLLLTIFLGMGVFTLLAHMTKPVVVNFALLPGTLVSELAYIAGYLVTGGEIRHAKIMPESKSGDGGQPTTQAQSKLGFFGPMLASTFAIVACGAAILAVNHYMGKSVIDQYAPKDSQGWITSGDAKAGLLPPKGNFDEKAPSTLVGAVNYFWGLLHAQIDLLKRCTDVLAKLQWKNLTVWLFVYLSLCLGVRLSVATRPFRPTLAAVVLITAAIAVIGAIWKEDFGHLLEDLWPLLSFVWALLLLTLVVALLASGVAALFRALAGKSEGKSGGARPAAKKE